MPSLLPPIKLSWPSLKLILHVWSTSSTVVWIRAYSNEPRFRHKYQIANKNLVLRLIFFLIIYRHLTANTFLLHRQ
jgi:hypothetical protein